MSAGDVRQEAMTAFYRAHALLDQARLRLWDEAGLTVSQLRLLYLLSDAEGIGNAELADKLLVTRPSVSALLERLERGGFIRREISPEDRRGICIWLEQRGRDAVEQMTGEMRNYVVDLMEDMDDREVAQLLESLTAFVRSGQAVRSRQLAGESADTLAAAAT